MGEVRVVEVFQSLCRSMQLRSRLSEMLTPVHGDTHQFQSVCSMPLNVIHNVTVYHPLRHDGKLILPGPVQNAEQLQDIWMGQRIPNNSLLTELLGDIWETVSAPSHQTWKTSFPLTLLLFSKLPASKTLTLSTATVYPLHCPFLISGEPSDV